MNALHPIFLECCHRERSGRYDLTKPFVHHNYIYATNGEICVRGPVPRPLPPLSVMSPEVHNLLPWNPHDYNLTPTSLPEVPPAWVECEDCYGCGCYDCGFSGKVEYQQAILLADGWPCMQGFYIRLLRRHRAAVYLGSKPNTRSLAMFVVPGTPCASAEGIISLMKSDYQDLGPIQS